MSHAHGVSRATALSSRAISRAFGSSSPIRSSSSSDSVPRGARGSGISRRSNQPRLHVRWPISSTSRPPAVSRAPPPGWTTRLYVGLSLRTVSRKPSITAASTPTSFLQPAVRRGGLAGIASGFDTPHEVACCPQVL